MLVADRYRLHVCIGRGGMGEVWQATDEVLGRAVAVKLMLANAADPSAGDRFRLEAQTAARLSHPHVVGVFDFGTWDGKLFLVMELVEGDSLAGSPSDPWSCRPSGSPWSPRTPPPGSRPRTGRAWCTGTSSRETCSSTPKGR